MTPTSIVPGVTSVQKILTPRTMRTSGMAAQPAALARSVNDVGGLILRVSREPRAPSGYPAVSSRRSTYEVCRNHARKRPRRARENQQRRSIRPANVREMPHPDVALERARLEFAQECLEAMRQRTSAR